MLDEELNIAYAKIRKALHEATKESKMIPFNELVEDVFTEHNISLHKILSYKSLYQLATIVSTSAFAKLVYQKGWTRMDAKEKPYRNTPSPRIGTSRTI